MTTREEQRALLLDVLDMIRWYRIAEEWGWRRAA